METLATTKNNASQTIQQSSWSASDQEQLVQALAIIANGQKAYGKQCSVPDLFAYFKMKLDGRFSMEAVLAAIAIYTDRKNDIPAPADLIQIMSPDLPKISTAEFIHAKEQHALEGYPAHGYYGGIIRQYEHQNADPSAKMPAPAYDRLAGTRALGEVIKSLT